MLNKSKLIKIGTALTAAYFFGVGLTREFFPEKANTQEDLMRIISEETSKLVKNKTPKYVYWTYGDSPWGTACSRKLGPTSYLVVLDKDRDRTTVKHELYHVYAGHCDKAFENGSWDTRAKIKNELTARLYADYGFRF